MNHVKNIGLSTVQWQDPFPMPVPVGCERPSVQLTWEDLDAEFAEGADSPDATYTTVTLDEVKAMCGRGEIKAPSPDAPTYDMPEGFWDDAEVVVRP